MAYSRYRRKTRRTYRKSGPKRRSSARPSRYTGRTRRYIRKRPMSKRSILNVTSEKKRDKMLVYTNSTSTSQSGGTTYSTNPAIITGGTSVPACFIWCATARDNVTNLTTPTKGTKFDKATRTSSSCYMVGLKEALEIQVADGLPWQWRRICFTYKGNATLNSYLPTSSTSFAPSLEVSSGYVRLLNQIPTANRATFEALLFQGVQGSDWGDQMTAKVDTERVSVKYDKTITIASGNEDGVIRKYNRWHSMGHNLEYDDDENGGQMSASGYSVESRRGMGDYWVVDYFRPRVGSSSSNQMLFNAESTLYWHEK